MDGASSTDVHQQVNQVGDGQAWVVHTGQCRDGLGWCTVVQALDVISGGTIAFDDGQQLLRLAAALAASCS